ncbi:hypothetical protein FACS1894154_07920 [Betaproteobacteria bacterium]|nr:hypothetical protein FACS1894154_07920 [Betaproteobacteria bacterium]
MENLQFAVDQALASARIEGYEAGDAFLADLDAFVKGEIPHAEMLKRALAGKYKAKEAQTKSEPRYA